MAYIHLFISIWKEKDCLKPQIKENSNLEAEIKVFAGKVLRTDTAGMKIRLGFMLFILFKTAEIKWSVIECVSYVQAPPIIYIRSLSNA